MHGAPPIKHDTDIRPLMWGWIALTGLTLFRLLQAGRFGLSVDESHYVLFARHPAWGYFDHPPMVAFLGQLSMRFGQGECFIRLGPILCSLAAMVMMWRLTARLYRNERVALFALVLFMLLPVHHLIGIALLPDATLNLFWCAGLLTVWHGLESGKWRWWFATGLAFGGMLLSKYHGVLFPLCFLLYVATGPDTRRWLRNPRPYAAGLIGCLIFLPNVVWNSRHEWISYAFQLGHGAGKGRLRLENVFTAIGGQLAAGSPILFVLFLVAAVVLIRSRPLRREDRFLLCASLPVFAFFCLIGLTGKSLPHWPAVAWFGAAPLLAAVWMRRLAGSGPTPLRWRRWGRAGVVTAAIMIVGMYTAITTPLIPAAYRVAEQASAVLSRALPAVPRLASFEPRIDITNDLYGWDETAAQVEAIRAAMPDPDRTFVFGHRFFTVSQLGAYLNADTVFTAMQNRPSQYWLWFDPPSHEGWDALFVDYHMRWHQGPDRYLPLFDRMDDHVDRIEITRRGMVIHRFDVYRYYGFIGARDN